MDPAAKRRYLEDENSSLMKTLTIAAKGFVFGSISAMDYDIKLPRGQRGSIGPMKIMAQWAKCGLTFAALPAIYTGGEQLLENHRMKKDVVNGTVSGFVAGATVLTYSTFASGLIHVAGNPRNIIITAIGFGSICASFHATTFWHMKKRSSTDACA